MRPLSTVRLDSSETYTLLDAVGEQDLRILERLQTSLDGLGSAQAHSRLHYYGPNVVPREQGPSLVKQFGRQLVHLFALMLWVGAVLAFAGGLPQLGIAIIVVVLINAVFSFAQEFRAEKATRALASLLPEVATVRSGGKAISIPAEELVPGDILLLREGDRISADARVLKAAALKVDNSMLTGESGPVERVADAELERPTDALDARCAVFAGTFVTSGSGVTVVVGTGAATRLGSISRLTADISRRTTPLRIELDRMVRVVGMFAVVAGVAFFGVSLAMSEPADDAFLFSIGVIVALIPEGLLPTFTLSLAMGASRMAERGALVRHLDAVETLGCTTVICTDKTGTITTNQMTAKEIVLPTARFTVSGSGYEPSGTILTDDRPLSETELKHVRHIARAGALCGDARMERREGRWTCVGDPTEGALSVMAGKAGVDRDTEERRAPRVSEYPFESVRQRMSTVHALPTGSYEVLTKGAPEIIVPLCKAIRHGDVVLPLDDLQELEIRKEVDRLAIQGLRVLALARRELHGVAPASAADAETEMEFLGLVGMVDPVRPEVPDAIARCQRAGIRIILITGDHPATAMRIAREIGIPAETVMIGAELPEEEAAIGKILASGVSVLARIAPEQKLAIAGALQAGGEVVAMTGDGVNDAPALRRADIGVAMGKIGTDVAREAADIVLLDDNFAHIVEAVEEGRIAFENMRKFLTYVLTSNVPELAPFLVWALTRGYVPLTLSVLQILAVDLATDLLPALALGAEKADPRSMSEPPRPRKTRLLNRSVLLRSYGFLGPIEAVGSLLMIPLGAAVFFGWSPGQPLPQGEAALVVISTMVWAAIVLAQVINAFECRSTEGSVLQTGLFSSRPLLAAIAVELFMMLVFIYLPPINEILGHHPIDIAQWTLVLVAPLLLLAGEELRKGSVRRRARTRALLEVPNKP